jgi:DNA-binding SARP family transcriptional activator
MARLKLFFLGPFQATLDGRPLLGFESNKVRALLAYLAVESARPHARETVAALLWPDHHNHSAVNSLRSALANLRGVINDRLADPPFLFITRETLQFNPTADCELDVAQLEGIETRSAGQLEAMVESKGEFLEGFSLPDSEPFEEWLLARREQFRRATHDALGRLARYDEDNGMIDRAIDCVRRQLELEAWDEGAHRRLMRLLARTDRRSQALQQYEACRRALLAELGVEPSQETKALYLQIRDETL